MSEIPPYAQWIPQQQIAKTNAGYNQLGAAAQGGVADARQMTRAQQRFVQGYNPKMQMRGIGALQVAGPMFDAVNEAIDAGQLSAHPLGDAWRYWTAGKVPELATPKLPPGMI